MKSLFYKKSYSKFLKRKEKEEKIIRESNQRVRNDDETFFDALLSDDADLNKTPWGRKILKILINSLKD